MRLFTAGWLAGLLATSSCALYAPTVPATPLLKKGQVEATASLRGATPQATVAWAPTPHLLLLGEAAFLEGSGSFKSATDSLTYRDYHRQGSLGLGYYHAPTATAPTYFAAVAGVGYAATSLHAIDFTIASPILPIPVAYYAGHYRARYLRYYGQAYVAWPHKRGPTTGLSVRGTVVDYTRLTLDGYPIRPTNALFVEPMFFIRFGQGPVRAQATAGLSLPLNSKPYNPINPRTAPVSWLISGGVVLRPDELLRSLRSPFRREPPGR